MPKDQAAAAEQPQDVPDEGRSGSGGETDWREEAEKWKALSRKNEERARANADKAARFDEIEERDKTDLQKAVEAKEVAERRAADLEVAALRARVAAAKGVDIDLLTGSTQEEVEASAARLLAWRDAAAPKPPASSSAGDAGPRGEPIGAPKQLTRADLAGMTPAQIDRARRAGQLNKIMGVTS